MWQAHKYLIDEPSDHYQSCIPNLRHTPTDELPNSQPNNAKSQLLYETFFKPAPNVLPTHANEEYPEPPTCFANITNDQISRAIKKLSPYKAPGLNGTCNTVFVNCSEELIPHMGPIFRATFDLKLYPEEWKLSTTVVLRKPGCPDYSISKAY